jgi:hypothetical protein
MSTTLPRLDQEIAGSASSLLKNATGCVNSRMRCQNNELSHYFASRAELGSALGEVEECHEGIFQRTARSTGLLACFAILLVSVAVAGCGSRTDPCDQYVETLASGNLEQRYDAAQVLGLQGQSAAHIAPALLQALNDKEPMVRAEVATALGRVLGVPAHDSKSSEVAQLQPSLSRDELFRVSEDVISALSNCLHDPDSQVRAAAAIAIARVGVDSDRALEALEIASQSSDRELAMTARFKLRQLQERTQRKQAKP